MSKSSVFGIGLVLLVVGFALGYTVAPPPNAPAAPEAETATKRPATRLFVPPKTRETVLEILRDAVREADAVARVTRVAAVLPALGPEILPEIRAVLDDTTLSPGGPATDLLLRWWAKTDPQGATGWARLKAGTVYKTLAITAAVETWAETDPEAAARHVVATSGFSSASSKIAEIALVRGWFTSGAAGLLEFVHGLGVSPQRQRAISVIARATIQRDGSAAILRWADAVPGDDAAFKLDVNRQVALQVGRADPEAALAWCARICGEPSGNMVRAMIAERWAVTDGRSAMAWLAAAPAGEQRDWAVKAAFRGWLRSNREELYAWVDAMGVDGVEPWFQPTVELLAITLTVPQPTKAVAWAGAITNPVDRERTYVTVARKWREKDPAAAEAWIAEMGFSESVRERIFAPPPAQRKGRTRAEAAADAEAAAAASDPASPGPASVETAPDAPTP